MIIRNARLLPELTDGFTDDGGDIVVENGKIADIVSAGSVSGDGEEIDATGMTVLPGLIDMHVHLALSGKDVLTDNFQTTPIRTLDAYKFALDTLRAGFTTVRDVGDADGISLSIRDEINAGRLQGPRIKASGTILTPTESGNEYFAELYDECDSVDQVRAACRRQFKAGADFIKVMASGAVSNPSGKPGMTIETKEELEEMVRCAGQHGTYVAAHCHGAESIELCIAAGARTIEHATIMNDRVISELKKGNSFIVPTICCTTKMLTETASFAEFMLAKLHDIVEQRNYWMKKAYAENIKMGFGTDSGTTNNWHGGNAAEFVDRVEILGMKPIDTLLQATRNSAEIMGVQDEVGSIAKGKYADLVFIDGRPETDIHLMSSGVKAVMKGGALVAGEI
jgi:imidazolonepropionase-like amidohydrolase